MSRTEDHNSIKNVLKAMETIKNYCAAGKCEGCIFSRPSLLIGNNLTLCYFADFTTIPSNWEIPESKEKNNA